MKAIYQWVLRTMMKDQTGVMQTLPKKDLVDFNVAMTAERLMRNGFEPNAFKNANQVENAINQIEAPRNVQQGIKSIDSAKVFDMEGKEIPKGSKIMGGKQAETEAEIAERISRENKESAKRFKDKMKDDLEDMAQGGRAGFKTGLGKRFLDFLKGVGKEKPFSVKEFTDKRKFIKADEIENKIQMMKNKKFLEETRKEFKKNPPFKFPEPGDKEYDEALARIQRALIEDRKLNADGGRIGFKDGMTRRTFLKLLGGLASIPIVGKILKPMKVGKTVTKVPVIKTDNVPGKPEWFDALVNKVIIEGDDVTKRFATAERQSIHQKTLDDGSVVRVTEDVDNGAVRVEYESDANVFEDTVQMEYKKPLPDEGDPRPAAEFSTAESGPVSRQTSPDDYDIDIDEVGGTSISDLDSDVSKLKEYATGQKQTLKEFVESKKRKDRAKRITTDPEAQSDAVIRRQGDYDGSDYDDYASGGIARMLGE
tara:strand:+ start:3 stop:1445 length:1443 start_codon:yes stop_codon:yes gene_type:complete